MSERAESEVSVARDDDQATRLRSRFRGSLLGGALGDALGAGVEFDSLVALRERHGPRGITGLVPAYGRLGAITALADDLFIEMTGAAPDRAENEPGQREREAWLERYPPW